MRRKLFVWLLVFALLMALPGCGRKEQEPEGGIQLYFLKDSGESTGSFVPGAALGTQSFDALPAHSPTGRAAVPTRAACWRLCWPDRRARDFGPRFPEIPA